MHNYRVVMNSELLSGNPWGSEHWRVADYCGFDVQTADSADAESWRSWVFGRFGGKHNIGIVAADTAFKAIFYDMDATAIREESLVEIAAAIGKKDAVEALTKQAMQGGMEFGAALKARLQMVRGVSKQTVLDVGAKLQINPGLEEFSKLCKTKGVKVFLVSGGFTILAEKLRVPLNLADLRANVLEFKDDKFTGNVLGAIVDAEAKLTFVREQCQKFNWDLREIAAVGDGANDIPMLKASGAAIGYLCKPILHPQIQAYIGNGDHGYLAPLLFGRGTS